MQYMLIIHEETKCYGGDEGAQLMEKTIGGHMKLIEELTASGMEWSGNRLKGNEATTTLRYQGGTGTLHDGAFAETHEELGGYYIVDVPDLDSALEWARKIPIPGDGAVEVRPVWEEA